MIFPYQGDFFHIFHDFPDFSLMVGSLPLMLSPLQVFLGCFQMALTFIVFNYIISLIMVLLPREIYVY